MVDVLVEPVELSSAKQPGLLEPIRYLGERCMHFFRVPDVSMRTQFMADLHLKLMMQDLEVAIMYDPHTLQPDMTTGTPATELNEFDQGNN